MAFHFTIKGATIKDTLRYIVNFINHYSTDPFVQQFAKEFGPSGDKQQYIRRIFDYICQNGFYQLDKDGEEEVWTPAKTIRTRNAQGKFQYDCKKITILLGAVLKAAGIQPVLKHVLYFDKANNTWHDYTHIYIIVPYPDMDHYLVVDPTNNCMWNTEVDHQAATLYFTDGTKKEIPANMNLHVIGNNNSNQANNAAIYTSNMFGQGAEGITADMNAIMGCSPAAIGCYNTEQQTISGSNEYFSFNTKENLLHLFNVTNPLMFAGRKAFLTLVYLGKGLAKYFKIHFAHRLALSWTIDKGKVRKTWWLLGGTKDAAALMKAITHGTGQTISGPYSYGNDVYQSISGPEIPAAIVAAAPAITAFLVLFKSLGVLKEGDKDNPPADGELPPPPPVVAGSFNFISDLCYGNVFNALIKSVIVLSPIKWHYHDIINFFIQIFS